MEIAFIERALRRRVPLRDPAYCTARLTDATRRRFPRTQFSNSWRFAPRVIVQRFYITIVRASRKSKHVRFRDRCLFRLNVTYLHDVEKRTQVFCRVIGKTTTTTIKTKSNPFLNPLKRENVKSTRDRRARARFRFSGHVRAT